MEQRLVDKLVNAMELTKGQVVLLNFWGEEEELSELYQFAGAVTGNGGMPMLFLHTSKYYETLFTEMEGEVPDKWFQQIELADVIIDLIFHNPGMPPQGLEREKYPMFGSYLQRMFQAFGTKEKFIQVTMPTEANAAMVEMDQETYRDRILKAMDIDYAALKESCKEKIDGFSGTIRTVRTGKDCVLTLDTTGREWITDAGDGALPCGEIYIAPVEEKSNGKVYFEHLVVEELGTFPKVTMEIAGGRIVSSDCPEFNGFLNELPEGGNVVAELGIGMNPNVDKMQGDAGLDENAIGTFHIGIGMNHLFGGKNQCPMHMDFVAEGVVE